MNNVQKYLCWVTSNGIDPHGRGITPDMVESDWQKLIEYMRSESIEQVFCGHTHRPFYKEIDKLVICNIGSAGMPLDGDPHPS